MEMQGADHGHGLGVTLNSLVSWVEPQEAVGISEEHHVQLNEDVISEPRRVR